MNFKTTLIMALVFAVGVVAVVLVNKKEAKDEEQKELEGKLLNVEVDDVKELILQPSGIHAVRDSNEWRIVAPVETDGDKSSIESVIRMFDRAKIDRYVSSDSSEYNVFGLESPDEKMIVIRDNQTDTLFVGDKNPTGSFVFARTSNSPDVFLTTTTLQTNVEKELFDLRNKKVLGFESGEVRRFELSNKNGTFVMSKAGGTWTLEEPMDAKADKSEVDGIISQLSSGQAKEFVAEDPASLEQYGLKNPSYRVDLFLGEERAKKTLLVGNKTDDKYYARDESRSPVFLVDTTLVSKLDVQLFDLRDKTFTEFNSSEINKFSIQANDTLFVFEKDTSDAWTIVEPVAKKAKNWKVSTMVGAANNLEIKEFVDDQTTNKRVYGLADPAIVGKYYKDDQVVLELSLGNVKGDLVYAARADDDRIVLIDQSTREKMTPDLDEIIDETTTETSSN